MNDFFDVNLTGQVNKVFKTITQCMHCITEHNALAIKCL